MDYKNITSFDEACAANGTTPSEVLPYNFEKELTEKQKWLNWVSILDEIATAIKKGDGPLDFDNRTQDKWFPIFIKRPGSGFALGGVYYDFTHTLVGARLSFGTREQAKHMAEISIATYNNYLSSQNS